MILTLPPLTVPVPVPLKIKSQKLTIDRPRVAGLYNKKMGATDGQDQKIAMYRPRIRLNKWLKRVVFHFLLVAAHNAHVIMKEYLQLKRGDACF